MNEKDLWTRAQIYFGYPLSYKELCDFMESLSRLEFLQFYYELGME